jgi:hypothetical protein
MVVVPFADSAVVDAVSVIVDPVGARSGTLWHAEANIESAAAAASAMDEPREHVSIRT